jgi:protein-disulfide isomerase
MPEPALPRLHVPVGEPDHVRGPATSPVTLVEYGDYQCPFCGRAHPVVRALIAQLGNRMRFCFRHFPLTTIHPLAQQAAEAAEAAGAQGRFWEMHDLLFAQETLDDDVLLVLPRSMGLNRDALENCLMDETVVKRIQASVNEANELGVNRTPTFFVGTRAGDGRVRVSRVLSGIRPTADFIQTLDATLAGEATGWRRWMPFLAKRG